MSYNYHLDDLIGLLHQVEPAIANALARNKNRVEHGLLSVGIKIHYMGPLEDFRPLVEPLGGLKAVLEVNHYRNEYASLCFVLPPVGNAQVAAWLIRGIEKYLKIPLFGNRLAQIQICSPGRLSARRAALLGVAFYLGSDTIRRYSLNQLETTFSDCRWDETLKRGRRLLLYDAPYGTFEKEFEWWWRIGDSLIKSTILPFSHERSDVLAGGSVVDLNNVNLIATLLVHSQAGGYWWMLGQRFEKELEALLKTHMLSGILEAPWIRVTENPYEGDRAFLAALTELMHYALEEVGRINQTSNTLRRSRGETMSIMSSVKMMLEKYRALLLEESRRKNGGGRELY